jgi:hypothetical protein
MMNATHESNTQQFPAWYDGVRAKEVLDAYNNGGES